MHGAFVEMGVSILGGGITTIGASIFLFMCYLSFFEQFGIFICSTIALSLLVSNTLYAALCFIAGPEGDTGNIFKMFGRK